MKPECVGGRGGGGPLAQEASDAHDSLGFGPFTFRTNRPTMISPKYRQKEERRKVLKISINKLKKIEDPESSLRRSVLINNTMKRLQREAREEKSQKERVREESLADITNLPKKEEEERRKRPAAEEEDVQAVLSQFYMPLTPRMITSLDEEEEIDVEGVEEAKRPRLEESSAAERLALSERANLYLEEAKSPFSCGHSSMFNELQTVVYHSLLASLET